MWSLVKSEIIYNKKFSVITYILPLVYIVLLLIGIRYDEKLYDFYRILGTLIFGMLPVLFIAVAFSSSLKESRTRKSGLVPIKIDNIGYARLLYFIIPLIYLNILGIFLLLISGNGWELISNKIVYEFGATAMLLAGLYISYEFLMVFEIQSDLIKILLGIVFFAIVLIILFKVDNKLWNAVPQAYIGWIYSSVSFLILSIGNYLFTKRDNYLS